MGVDPGHANTMPNEHEGPIRFHVSGHPGYGAVHGVATMEEEDGEGYVATPTHDGSPTRYIRTGPRRWLVYDENEIRDGGDAPPVPHAGMSDPSPPSWEGGSGTP